ncbi:MAG: hypothetical protein K9L19_13490 [Desulfarculaceae bacterium]|nr:hypothetical protein [Desulfarculaceae bacterium]MCF8048556.1 hypothetical protein [Desulfarculaceae bacterium]
MAYQYTYRNNIVVIISVLVLFLSFFVGCGQPWEEKQAKKNKIRTEKIKKEKQKIENIISNLKTKYNAIYFPPKSLDPNSVTYIFQNFIETNSGKLLIFKGYFEDIEQYTDGNIFIEFSCPLLEQSMTNERTVLFRLLIDKNNLNKYISFKSDQYSRYHRIFRWMRPPDFIVVAKINDLKSLRIFRFKGHSRQEEVQIDKFTNNYLVSTGVLVDAVVAN